MRRLDRSNELAIEFFSACPRTQCMMQTLALWNWSWPNRNWYPFPIHITV